MVAPDTKEERSVRKQRELLDGAERIYLRDGDLGLTVRRLAAEADTTSQTIYTYFGSRDAVLDAMVDRVLGELDRVLDQLESPSTEPVDGDRLGALAVLYGRYSLAHPPRFRMLASAHSPEGWKQEAVAERRRRLVQIVADLLPSRDEATARILIGAWNGLIQAALDGLVADISFPGTISMVADDSVLVDDPGVAADREPVAGRLEPALVLLADQLVGPRDGVSVTGPSGI
ncbi:MAG: TetR/AcrR family transcriptional regulator [Acidimicrobiales bacterium]